MQTWATELFLQIQWIFEEKNKVNENNKWTDHGHSVVQNFIQNTVESDLEDTLELSTKKKDQDNFVTGQWMLDRDQSIDIEHELIWWKLEPHHCAQPLHTHKASIIG